MTKNEIFQLVKKNILEVLPDIPVEEITIDKRLKDLGANSIDRTEITIQTMKDLQIKIPLVTLAQVKNIEGLIDVFLKSAGQ